MDHLHWLHRHVCCINWIFIILEHSSIRHFKKGQTKGLVIVSLIITVDYTTLQAAKHHMCIVVLPGMALICLRLSRNQQFFLVITQSLTLGTPELWMKSNFRSERFILYYST